MKPRQPPTIAPTTVTRRSVLEWLGKAAVLTLGADLLHACGTTADLGPGDAGLLSGQDLPDAAPVTCATPAGFPFEPGTLEENLTEAFRVRTVDPQDLQQILASWRLQVDGLVEEPRVFSFADLMCLTRQDQITDFHCVEGWSVLDVPWNGVHLSSLFARCRPTAEATHVTFHTLGGKYNESLPLDVAREPRTILGYGIGGATLPLDHGFPLRLVVPRLLGYKSAKYVERIELDNQPVYGFWVRSGYPYEGEVPEARLRDGKY